ncbi:phosphohydrolase [Synergistales bacterium]|nr:phosphohydrolase [Synergistales bacterium]
MKNSVAYKKRIPIEELLDNPKAYLTRDVLSQTGTTVLIPSKIPIGKLSEGLDNPRRLVDTLANMGIGHIDIEIPNELEDEEVLSRLKELDTSVTVIDDKVSKEAQTMVNDIYASVTLDGKYSIPKQDVEQLSGTLTNELRDVSQIAISLVASSEDSYTQSHAVNVSLLAGYIAKKLAELGKVPADIIDKAVLAGLLFDIGKTRVPPEILNKDGKLTEEEFAKIKEHVWHSISLCKEAGITDKEVLDGIVSHHEKYDGSGYPSGLVGEQIPIIGRILSVADTFDAMTSQRIYKSAVSSKLSFNFIMSANETAFDPDICQIFIAGMGVYPPGSTVELSNGKIAVVIAITPGNLLQPKVTLKEGGETKIIDLAAERLFIRKSLDVEEREVPDLLAELSEG